MVHPVRVRNWRYGEVLESSLFTKHYHGRKDNLYLFGKAVATRRAEQLVFCVFARRYGWGNPRKPAVVGGRLGPAQSPGKHRLEPMGHRHLVRHQAADLSPSRSEERRVGKDSRARRRHAE